MNARGTDEEVFACVLTCGVSARRTAGEKTQRGGGDGNVRKRGWERAVCGQKRGEEGELRERARVRLAVRPSTREEARESDWFLARAETPAGSASGKSFGLLCRRETPGEHEDA